MSNLHPIFEQALKPFAPKQDAISEGFSKIYDLAIDHAIEIVRDHYTQRENSFANSQIDSIVLKLKALKK